MTGPQQARPVNMRRETKAALKNIAFQIGQIIVNERNRRGKTQIELAAEAGTVQPYISLIETGLAVPTSMSNAQIERVFTSLGMSTDPRREDHFVVQASFLGWWRDIQRDM